MGQYHDDFLRKLTMCTVVAMLCVSWKGCLYPNR
jgi:hypothetical protein